MKDMMKKAKRMLAYLIVLVMCVDMVSQSSFVSRAQEATEKTEGTAAVEKPAEKAADQQTASSTESAASEPKEAGAENGVVGTTTGTQSAETEVSKTENVSEEQSDEKTTGETTGDKKAELTEEEKAAADLVSRIEQALAGIPDQGSLKGTEEEMEALNKQGQNLQDLYEECNEYKDIEEVAAAQESLAQAITRLQELMGLSAEMLAACGENCTHVAAIGDTHFDTLQDAITAVAIKDTKEIMLLKDVTIASTAAKNEATLNIPAGVTLDGNGKTITAGTFAEAHMLGVTNAAGVTIKNLTVDMNKAANSTSKHALNVFGATASVTLENVTLKNANTAGMVVNAGTANVTGLKTEGNVWGAVNVDKKGKLTIDTIADLKENKKVWSECGNNDTGSEVVIQDNGYKRFKVVGYSNNAYNYQIYYALDDSEATVTALGGVCVTTGADGIQYVCDTPGRGVDHTPVGGTLKLLSQWSKTSYTTINKSMTLDLGGNLVNSNNKNGTIIVQKDANVTIKDGKIGHVQNNSNGALFIMQGTVTLENVILNSNDFGVILGSSANTSYYGKLFLNDKTKVSSDGACAIAINGNGRNNQTRTDNETENRTKSEVVVNAGAEVIGKTYGIAGNGTMDDTLITINGGKVTADGGRAGEAEYSAGIYHPQQGTLTINGGIISGKVGVQMAAGTAVINGGTLESTDKSTVAAPFKAANQGDGMVLDGAALSMVSRSAYGNISVTVKGGTFNAQPTNKPIQKYGMQKTTTAWEVIAEPTKSDLAISGGTFSNAFDASYCAEGYYLKFLGNGCTVEESKSGGALQPAVGITVPSSDDSDTTSMTLTGTTVTDLVNEEDATNVAGITLETKTISKDAVETASDEVKKDVKQIVETVSQTSNIQADIKAAVKLDDNKQVSDVKIQSYLDINLFKVKETAGDSNTDNNNENKVSQTKKKLSFTVPIPKGAKEGEKFVVLRNHNGEVAVLLCEQDDQAGTLTFETDLFSVYAIASYKEVKTESTTGVGGNNGGGSGSSNDNSQPAQVAPIISVEPAIMEAAPAAAPTNVAAVPPQPVEEEKKTQEPALKEDKTAKRKETTFGDAAADDLVTIENDDTPLAIGKTESNWLIWILSGMSVLFAAAFVGFELLTKKRRDEE